jgi:hypothetical protein
VEAGFETTSLSLYLAVIESTVGLFFASHVCCAFSARENKDKAMPPTIPAVFFINKILNDLNWYSAATLQNFVPE